MVSIDDLNDAYKRINPYIVKTPIHISEALNKKFDSNIFLKDETKQLTGSFKIRGALSALSKLKQNNINGVVAFSSGNHAQGVSKAAQIFDMENRKNQKKWCNNCFLQKTYREQRRDSNKISQGTEFPLS